MGEQLLASFDTNVFDNLVEKPAWITEQDELRLRAAVRQRKLAILPSILTIDETAANVQRPEKMVPTLRLIWELCDWDRIIKPPDVMLADDIKHFAFNGEAAHPFVDAKIGERVRTSMRELLEDGKRLTELRDVVRKHHPARRARFRISISSLIQDTQTEFLAAKEREKIDSFGKFFERELPLVGSSFVEPLSSDLRARPFDEFVKVRSIRMALGMTLSYVWACNVDGWEVGPSDTSDLQHPIPAAAAADVFVTHDRKLANLVRRVPMKGLRVASLPQLLDRVD